MVVYAYNPRRIGITPTPDQDCDLCSGSGICLTDGKFGQQSSVCDCVAMNVTRENLNKTWPYMAHRVNAVEKTPLRELDRRKLFARIIADQRTLAAHLRCCIIEHCIYDDDLYWWVEVSSDKEVVEAWLHNLKVKGEEIIDADVASTPLKPGQPRSIKEFAMRSQLMVLQLGKKVAPNKETHTCLVEAIEYRIDQDLPLWIVTHPDEDLAEGGLMAYSKRLMDDLKTFEFVQVSLNPVTKDREIPESHTSSEIARIQDAPTENGRLTISQGSTGNRRTVGVEMGRDKKYKGGR